jgi:predicted PurR-regulated permease PerM
MAQLPKTIPGKVFLALFVIAAVPVLVWFAIMLSGPIVWASVAVIVISAVVLFIRRRRDDAARERAWVGAFSFADVVARKRADATLDHSIS